MLRSIDWFLVTDVSGQPIGPIFLDCLTPEDGTDSFPETLFLNTQLCLTENCLGLLL